MWNLRVDPEGASGVVNMAVDQALLEEADRSGGAFLRLYRWSPPCLSFGRNEPALARYDKAAIERLGIDVVRRPTGGRAVWHEHEVTYAVAAPVAAFGSLRESYCAVHARIAEALRSLGIAATLAPHGGRRMALSGGACFAEAVGGEVVVNGRKLVGSAQIRHGSAFLQHGSILLDGSQEVIERISQTPSAIRRPPTATTLREVLGRPVTFQEVADALLRTWGDLAETALDRPPPSSAVGFGSAWTWRR